MPGREFEVEIASEMRRLAYTVKEAAFVLNVSEKTIRRFIDRGIFTCSTALRKKLIPRKQIEDFLK
jgi:excisionase family DNA binding protein